MKKDVAIVFGITKNYTFALANVLIGMKKHCKPFWDDIIVYHDGISEEEQCALSSICQCTFIVFNESLFNEAAIHSEALKNYSLLTLARFECFGLLAEYQTVIWHDVDILIQKDFSQLVNYGTDSGFAATQSKTFRMEQNFFGLMPGYNMLEFLYNAGILVLHDSLPNYTDIRVYCYNIYNHYAAQLRYNDQSVLNMMIQDYKIRVDCIDLDQYCCHPSTINYEDAVIIHAYGTEKFWNSAKLEKQFPEWHENNREWNKVISGYQKKTALDASRVSVLMSVFERTEYLKDAVKSILNQTYTNFEFIIVVEYSTIQEQICHELESFSDNRIVLIRNNHRLGFSASLNVALDTACGQYIARMDDDDISAPDRLEKQVRFLDLNPSISVVGSWIHVFGREDRVERRPEKHEELLVWAIKENPMFHPTIMIRKADMDQHRFQYDPMWFTEDYDLWLRMMQKLKFANIPEELLYFRASIQNTTVNKAQNVLDSHLRLMQRNLKERLDLDFTRDEMLLLRQPSIIHECYNEAEMQRLRDSVTYKIYEANKEKQVFNQNILESYLGEVKYDFKTETKLRLKKYPKFYLLLRRFYRFLFRKDVEIPHRRSLFTRIKMRIFPPSSKSFHENIQGVQRQLNQQQDMLSNLAKQSHVLQTQMIWTDEVVRRLFQENQAGFWGIYQCIPKESLRNEFVRKEQYSDYISALYILGGLAKALKFRTIHSFDANNFSWLIAAENLHLCNRAANDVQSQDKAGYQLAIGSHMIDEDFSINHLCQASPIVLYYLAQKRSTHPVQELHIHLELERCRAFFHKEGYACLDLRPGIRNNWEVSNQYTQSLSLYVRQNLWAEVLDHFAKNCAEEYEVI